MICLLQTYQVICCDARGMQRPFSIPSRSLSQRAHYHLPAADVLEALLGGHCKPCPASPKHDRES